MEALNVEALSPDSPLWRLSADVRNLAQSFGAFAQSQALPMYLVGGLVRDLLHRGDVSPDLDFMLEGNALEFIRALDQRWEELFPAWVKPAKPVTFKRYRTAKLVFGSPLVAGVSVIDFSSARGEHYPLSAQAPVVHWGNLSEDLRRRDFTINALAIAVNGDQRGQIIDVGNCLDDLSQGILRVFHEKSFVDDPARLIRAVRFLVRLEFSLSPETKTLFEQGSRERFLNRLPRPRLFDELRKVVDEEKNIEVLEELHARGLLQQIDSRLLWNHKVKEKLRVLNASRTSDVSPEQELPVAMTGRDSFWRRGICALLPEGEQREEVLKSFALAPKVIARIVATGE